MQMILVRRLTTGVFYDPATYEVCDAKRVLASQCAGGDGFSDPNPDVTKPYTEHDPSAGDGRYTLRN